MDSGENHGMQACEWPVGVTAQRTTDSRTTCAKNPSAELHGAINRHDGIWRNPKRLLSPVTRTPDRIIKSKWQEKIVWNVTSDASLPF